MDAFEKPEVKTTTDLLKGFMYYMGQGCFVEQEDVSRFVVICEELVKRRVAYSDWI